MSLVEDGELSESRIEPGLERVLPPERICLGRGIVLDYGGSPSVVDILEAPERFMRAIETTLCFYDIERQEHRLWQVIPYSDRPMVNRNACSFPDYLVYAIKQERDYLLNEKLRLTARVELLQRDLERSRAKTKLAKEEALILWKDEYKCQNDLSHTNRLF